MYRIEFNGRLLNGFDPQFVRLEVGVRLRLREAQIERLFSGQTVVLKKAVSAESSQAYLAELHSIGLDAVLVPLDTPEPPKEDSTGYKIVFWGKTLPGFERNAVMASAVKRLRVPPAQLIHIFSGAKVVLKRGVLANEGARYVVEMALIGMQIELEAEASAAAIAAQETPQGVPELPSAAQQEDDPQYAALLQTACDLSGTAFSGYDTSSSFAQDDQTPAPPEPSRVAPKASPAFNSANTDGYLNCPRCGVYQPYSTCCTKCGVELPKPRAYVGRSAVGFDSAPTTIVRTEEMPKPLARRKPQPESLHDLLAQQEQPEFAEARFPYIKLSLALLLLSVVIVVLLR